MNTATITAQSVSAALRRAGFLPVPDRRREGIRVSRGAFAGSVTVTVDIDAPRACARMTADAVSVLSDMGYTVEQSGADPWLLTVTRPEDDEDDEFSNWKSVYVPASDSGPAGWKYRAANA